MYLQKQITTGFGFPADCWTINVVTVKAIDDETYEASGNISLYFNNDARLSGAQLIDNARFSFRDLTVAEVDGNTRQALAQRIMASRLDDEGKEQNVYQTSHSGEVFFQDAIIVG